MTSDKKNAHRYLKLDDVLDYKRRMVESDQLMDEYVSLSEELRDATDAGEGRAAPGA